MKNVLAIIILSLSLCVNVMAAGNYSQRMIDSQGKAWSQDKAWDYVSGLVTKSILKYTEHYPGDVFTTKAYGWCKVYADNALYSNGTFINFKKGSLDNIASG